MSTNFGLPSTDSSIHYGLQLLSITIDKRRIFYPVRPSVWFYPGQTSQETGLIPVGTRLETH